MAKIKVELELEYVDEDYTLEATVKQNIIDRLSAHIIEKNLNNLNNIIEKNVNDKIDIETTKYVKQWFNKKHIEIKDSWGDTIKKHTDINALLKEKFNNALNVKVDKEGKAGGYHADQTRLEWIIDTKIKKTFKVNLKEKLDKVIQEVKKELENKIENDVKFHLGQELYETLNMKRVLIQNNQEDKS